VNEVFKEWLSERTSVPQAEGANMDGGRPFGYQNRKWERLKAQLLEGDELWEFCSPPESWAHRKGRQGYAIVRRGTIVDALTTTMS
jgi:hypothetical protein